MKFSTKGFAKGFAYLFSFASNRFILFVLFLTEILIDISFYNAN